MTIRVDVTEISTVVRCSSCPGWYWAGGGRERDRGHKVAMLHEASVHPGQLQAHEAARKYAARAKNVPEPDGSSGRGNPGDADRDRVGDQTAIRGRLPESP